MHVMHLMQSGITDRSFDTALHACAARVYSRLGALIVPFRKRAFKACLRTMLAAMAMSTALSGCGVFCGGAGGSGGGFAGGCATGMRF